MRVAAVLATSIAVLTASPVTARADDADDDDGGGEPRLIPRPSESSGSADAAPPPRRDGHKGQLGLAAQVVTGSRFIKTYDGEFCGDRSTETGNGNATACFSRVPVTLDLTASYGLTPRIELLLELRLGLERDFGATAGAGDGPRLRHYAPGVRFYFNQDEMVKFFSTAQLALDATGYKDAAGQDLGADVAIRNANGIMVDFHDAYGAYAFFGEELAFGRWLEAGLELGLGIQGRYP
ncbi:MAG TPA: hypothetical protein VM734_06270 [Kofleriaceae bacterium]|jgi:hypothetical protein|nr:hypothetical protein [Kofleriaceae bacterium]